MPIIDQAARVLARVKDRAEAAGITAGSSARGLGRLRAKDNPMTLHDLRHTFATIAVRVFDLVDVQAYLGHSNIDLKPAWAFGFMPLDPASS